VCIAGCEDGTVVFLSLENLKILGKALVSESPITSLNTSDKHLLCGSKNGEIIYGVGIDDHFNGMTHQVLTKLDSQINSVEFSNFHNEKIFLVSTGSSINYLWRQCKEDGEDHEYEVVDKFDVLENPHDIDDEDIQNEEFSLKNLYAGKVIGLTLDQFCADLEVR
jgi:hypothetical protein